MPGPLKALQDAALAEEQRLAAEAVAAAQQAVRQAALPAELSEALRSQLRSVAAAAADPLPVEVLSLNEQWLEARAARAWGENMYKI